MRRPKKPPKDPQLRLQEQYLVYARNKLFKEKEVKEKAVRKDVQERALTNANSTFTVVKTTWKALGRRAVRLLDLETALREVNKTIAEAYLLANVHVVRLCSAGIPLCKLNQTFFRRCLSAVSVSEKEKPEVDDFELRMSIKLYRSWRPQGYVPPVSTHLATGFQQQASQQMATNMRNSTVANFYRRFKRYLKVRYSLDGKQAYEALQSIRAVDYEGEDPLVKRYRDMLPPKPEKGRLEEAIFVVHSTTKSVCGFYPQTWAPGFAWLPNPRAQGWLWPPFAPTIPSWSCPSNTSFCALSRRRSRTSRRTGLHVSSLWCPRSRDSSAATSRYARTVFTAC
jgi:hypothetical protein